MSKMSRIFLEVNKYKTFDVIRFCKPTTVKIFNRTLKAKPFFCQCKLFINKYWERNGLWDHGIYYFSTNTDVTHKAVKFIYEIVKGNQRLVNAQHIQSEIEKSGIQWSDPRLQNFRNNIEKCIYEKEDIAIPLEQFAMFLEEDESAVKLLCRIFSKSCIIPNFHYFTEKVRLMCEDANLNTSGKVADYIPELAKQNPDLWGISICTIDGQRFSFGDFYQPFCLQSCVKPLVYAIAISEYNSGIVHHYTGVEPSGRLFNSLELNEEGKPHNPMINSGAIVVCSLIEQGRTLEGRFLHVAEKIKELCGGDAVGFNEMVFRSEKEVSFRNYAITYLLMENKGFPPEADLHETMDLYLKLCAVTVTCESGSIAAATLANGGENPFYEEKAHRMLGPSAVRNTLSLMHSCGMYDYSGKFAFHVGLPAKSGVAGGLLVVIPNVMGIMCRSPKLDDRGNPVKGLQFCRQFIENFNFHVYDNLRHAIKKTNPRELGRDLTDLEMELQIISRKLLEA